MGISMLARGLKALNGFRHWLNTGAAWHWYSLATVTLSGLLIAALIVLVTSQGLGYFWPASVQEWVISESKAVDSPLQAPSSQRLFVRVLEQQPVVSAQPALPADDTAQTGLEYFVQFQEFVDGTANWRYAWVEAGRIIRVTRPQSLLEVHLSQGGSVFGYPLVIDSGEQQFTGQALHALLRDGGWRELMASGEVTEARLLLRLQDGSDFVAPLTTVRNVLFPNDASLLYRVRQFTTSLWVFLSTGPQPDYQGGILPAIYGTVLLVLLMSVILVPLGVLTAVYLHEYASNNLLTKTLRIAVSNLAGIPGIVYGVFVLGVFVYGLGAQIDQWFFNDRLPLPTFGTGGILWASLALALLTLPVVIVATEEGLARVPNDLRRGALALGATRSEMIWGTVVTAASPAILTGLILAIARAAGEVAPLLLVGAVKYTGQPLLESSFPYLHAERQFMHLGYQVYDFALQSTNTYATIPLAYATTLILLALVILLNLIAIRLRARLRRRFLIDYS